MVDRSLARIIEEASTGRPASATPRQYEAVTQRPSTKRELRLWLRTSRGTSHHIQYAQIIDIVALEPNMVTIVCATGVFMVTCQNMDLMDLEVALHDEKVYRLQPFNAKFFDQPDAGASIISNITLQERRSVSAGSNKEKKPEEAAQKTAENVKHSSQ